MEFKEGSFGTLRATSKQYQPACPTEPLLAGVMESMK
jgi:hypothetical protein